MPNNYSLYNTIKIRRHIWQSTTQNLITLPRPSDFSPQRENVLRAEYTTAAGTVVADRIGWKFSDMQLQWDLLPQSLLRSLMEYTSSGDYLALIFEDASGTTYEEQILVKDHVSTGTRMVDMDGNAIWKDVRLGVRFNGIHS